MSDKNGQAEHEEAQRQAWGAALGVPLTLIVFALLAWAMGGGG